MAAVEEQPVAETSSARAVRGARPVVSLAASAAIAEQTSLAAAPVVVDTEPQVCVAVAASSPVALQVALAEHSSSRVEIGRAHV